MNITSGCVGVKKLAMDLQKWKIGEIGAVSPPLLREVEVVVVPILLFLGNLR